MNQNKRYKKQNFQEFNNKNIQRIQKIIYNKTHKIKNKLNRFKKKNQIYRIITISNNKK